MTGWGWGVAAALAAVLGLLPLAMTLANRRRFLRPRPRPEQRAPDAPAPAVSVLIPARNEEAAIGSALEAVLSSEGVELEVIVLDDQSIDGTAEVVAAVARRDPRVRLVEGGPLPAGWNGKQHACQRLAELATHERLTWLDADVRLSPDALARMAAFHDASGAALVSGFPGQVTGSWLEHLVISLVPAVLVGYLPMDRMRASSAPAYAAGCGQWFMAWREDYRRAGGHAAIRASRHDGLRLPRAFRRAGLMTDVCDASDLARCRMYRSAPQVWAGLAKNATEAMAAPTAIATWTVLLLGGWVLPWAALAAAAGVAAAGGVVAWWLWPVLAVGTAANAVTSVTLGRWFEQPRLAVIGRPLGVAALVAIQWYALGRQLAGRPLAWRGRLR